ncbi:MAG: alanyl-tRNA editing protein [Proteobacteria bacterium]|nr:alanyl-tRNA editing protein [Pseudomonadota bacterium]
MRPNKAVDSALHVLKGAVEQVLQARVTTRVHVESHKGALTVEFEGEPTQNQIEEIETLANDKIREDVPIETLSMSREEAEERFGDRIYDKFPVPSHIRELTIVRIRDWNINCCIGEHCKSTGEIGKIRIIRAKPKEKTKELVFSFEVLPRT